MEVDIPVCAKPEFDGMDHLKRRFDGFADGHEGFPATVAEERNRTRTIGRADEEVDISERPDAGIAVPAEQQRDALHQDHRDSRILERANHLQASAEEQLIVIPGTPVDALEPGKLGRLGLLLANGAVDGGEQVVGIVVEFVEREALMPFPPGPGGVDRRSDGGVEEQLLADVWPSTRRRAKCHGCSRSAARFRSSAARSART